MSVRWERTLYRTDERILDFCRSVMREKERRKEDLHGGLASLLFIYRWNAHKRRDDDGASSKFACVT